MKHDPYHASRQISGGSPVDLSDGYRSPKKLDKPQEKADPLKNQTTAQVTDQFIKGGYTKGTPIAEVLDLETTDGLRRYNAILAHANLQNPLITVIREVFKPDAFKVFVVYRANYYEQQYDAKQTTKPKISPDSNVANLLVYDQVAPTASTPITAAESENHANNAEEQNSDKHPIIPGLEGELRHDDSTN